VLLQLCLQCCNDCRIPKTDAVGYRYTEVVRKQDLRRKMDGFACFQCQQVLWPIVYSSDHKQSVVAAVRI